MSDYQPRLFTYDEWCALTDEQRQEHQSELMQAVEELQQEHDARKRLNDALTVERFARHDT